MKWSGASTEEMQLLEDWLDQASAWLDLLSCSWKRSPLAPSMAGSIQALDNAKLCVDHAKGMVANRRRMDQD